MTLDELRRRVEPETQALRAKGVQRLYVFGSVARGEAGLESDVDLFVDPEPGRPFSMLDLADVQNRLSERIGVAADVHTRNGLHYWIRDRVLAEAVRLF